MILEFGQYRVNIDVEKTRNFYESAEPISAGCSCANCRNFEKAVTLLPEDVQTFFSNLGVDIQKPHEVYANCQNADGTLLYGGFYYLCGTLSAGKSVWVTTAPGIAHWDDALAFPITKDFRISLQQADLSTPKLLFEISAKIPWVLKEETIPL